MEPIYALVILATIVAVRPFIETPDAKAKGEAQKLGGYTPSAKLGCLYLLLLLPLLGLWWYYALATDQILLGVIPTLGMAATAIAQWVEHTAAAKGGA